jgi:hypothetical protein
MMVRMNLLAVALVYAGLLAAFVAAVSAIRPPRKRPFRALAAGVIAFAVGLLLPQGETRVAVPQTRLDQFSPVYQFNEAHSVRIHASRDQVYAAIRGVTPDEIAFFRALTWIRRFGKPGPQSILIAPRQAPLLETAIRTGFLPLAEDPGKEIVIAAVMGRPTPDWARAKRSPEQFKSLQTPNVAKIAMNFRVEERNAGECELFTETRVFATNASGRLAFAGYWRVIYPGSALIRRMWLRAIRLRAEAMAA